ncbi:hypothetical protein MRX96_012422 [Rhipicephalus microplus]
MRLKYTFYTRGGPFCLGMIFGYLFTIKPKLSLNKMEELLWNVLACIIVSVPVHLLLEVPFVRLGEQCCHEEDEDSVYVSVDITLQEKNVAS